MTQSVFDYFALNKLHQAQDMFLGMVSIVSLKESDVDKVNQICTAFSSDLVASLHCELRAATTNKDIFKILDKYTGKETQELTGYEVGDAIVMEKINTNNKRLQSTQYEPSGIKRSHNAAQYRYHSHLKVICVYILFSG